MVNIKYSQNFYKNKINLQRLIKISDITSNDVVLDIGAGTGFVTEELLKCSKKVIAYELDKRCFDILVKNFSNYSNILLINEDFLKASLPQVPFKIFSNIPFCLTSDIINKITDVKCNLREAFLFVQKESALRFLGKPKNTQISSIISFMYEISILEELEKEDFKPVPKVDIVLLNLKRRDFEKRDYNLYRDFVSYIFNQRGISILDILKKLFTYKQLKYIRNYVMENGYVKPTDIPSTYYFEIFQIFKKNGEKHITRVKGYYLKNLSKHSSMQKLNRTRI